MLEDYFGYRVTFVMNVTDVDDKIILRARRGYLLKKYEAETKTGARAVEDARKALAASAAKQQGKVGTGPWPEGTCLPLQPCEPACNLFNVRWMRPSSWLRTASWRPRPARAPSGNSTTSATPWSRSASS